MGQAQLKKRRIDALRSISVGPGSFMEQPRGALVLLARLDDDSRLRLRSAIQDVIQNPAGALRLIDGLDATTVAKVGWAIVVHAYGAWTHFKLIKRDEQALPIILDVFGEGLAARRLRWSAWVFGTPTDVGEVRQQVARFAADMLPVDSPFPTPKLGVITTPQPKLLIEVSRTEIETMDLAPTLTALDTFATDLRMLDRVPGGVQWSISGYDDDPRSLAEIPEVALFLREIAIFAPWAPLVTDASLFMLWCKSINDRCTIETEQGITTVHLPDNVADEIMEEIARCAAELVVERLMIDPVPPVIIEMIEAWNRFLSEAGAATKEELIQEIELEEAVESAMNEVAVAALTKPAQNEQEFWQSITDTIAPGWILGDTSAGMQMPGGTDQVVLYVVDTRTGWTVASGVPLTEVERLRNALTLRPPEESEAVPGVAISAILKQAQLKVKADDPENKFVILATATALTFLKVYEVVRKNKGSPSGEYLYMVYSPTDGEPMGRSIYLESLEGDDPKLRSLEDVFMLAAQAIHADLNNPEGVVGGYIARHGGLQLCGVLKTLVSEASGSA